MNLGSNAIFELSRAKLAYLGQSQAVLAQNIANADTASYRAQEVRAPDFAELVRNGAGLNQTGLTRTHANHLQGGGSSRQEQPFRIVDSDITGEFNPNNNGVNIETELQKVAFTQAEYAQVINIYRKNVELLQAAVGTRS